MFSLQRYFVDKADWKGDTVVIREDDAHHIQRVMRMNENDKIICNHEEGYAAICQIIKLNKSTVEAKIVEKLAENMELPVAITIAQGLPKGDKFDFVLQKGTELGANAFIPFQADRSVVQWDQKKYDKKKKRFTKIIKEASEQSHRNMQPQIHPVMSLKELITESKQYDVKVFPYEEEAKGPDFKPLAKVLNDLKPGKRMLVCIGPEGGFSDKEVNILKGNGFHSFRIGPRILRTETAALYVLSSISYHFEELGCT